MCHVLSESGFGIFASHGTRWTKPCQFIDSGRVVPKGHFGEGRGCGGDVLGEPQV